MRLPWGSYVAFEPWGQRIVVDAMPLLQRDPIQEAGGIANLAKDCHTCNRTRHHNASAYPAGSLGLGDPCRSTDLYYE